MSLEIFYEKIAEGFLASACTKIQVQGQSSSPAGGLVGRDHFYIGFQRHMLSWREHLSAHVARVRREASARPGKVKKCTTMYRRKCDVGLRIGQCFEVFPTKLNYWE
jgi:hypothetical protein